jgi:hypothetical protein
VRDFVLCKRLPNKSFCLKMVKHRPILQYTILFQPNFVSWVCLYYKEKDFGLLRLGKTFGWHCR